MTPPPPEPSAPRPRGRLACALPAAVAAVATINPSAAGADTRPPNVVVILTDDQGWGDLSLHGNTDLATPHIDSLARDGAAFDRFFVCPVCSPTRAEFLTGRYHPRGGVHGTSAGGERLDLDETTVAELFQRAGYATAAFGKWHNGMQPPYHPNARGFDEFYGFCSGHWGDYFSPPLEHNGRPVTGEGFIIDDLTGRAIGFIEKHRDERFFVYLPFNTPHSPMQVPDRWWDRFNGKKPALRPEEAGDERAASGRGLDHNRAALAMCENIDWNVGRLLARLEELELDDNTVVAFFCDNGPNGRRWNGGMKGIKGSTDEGGVRSPLLVRWPGRIPAGRVVSPIAGAIDLLPTLADLAGIPVEGTRPLDGRSLAPLLTDAEPPAAWPDDRLIVSHWRNRVSVRTQTFRLDHQGQLFDMIADPGQARDVAADHQEIARRLGQAAAAWRAELLPGLEDDDRPFPVGHPGFRFTQLPARDGVPHGGIERSNRFPNCSFFRNWTSTEDAITWDVEVLAAGTYEVAAHYTCPRDDTGSTVELSFGGRRLVATVSEPHDPPVRGGEHDRVPRMESLVKDFRPMVLGTIELAKGRGPLTLRALEVPGSTVMDLRLLFFARVDADADAP